MKTNKNDKEKCGIYCIRNITNNKVYIGKSINIYRRINEHIYDLNNQNTSKENRYLINSWLKYGRESFEYFVLEYLEIDEDLVKKKELEWMKMYKSLNRLYGYNLRSDSETKMIVHKFTSEKISKRLKKEWLEGIRKDHGKKLSDNWKLTPNRNIEQSILLSKIKTKYKYYIYKDDKLIDIYTYKQLKEKSMNSVLTNFYRNKKDTVCYKEFIITRVKIEDIVQSS